VTPYDLGFTDGQNNEYDNIYSPSCEKEEHQQYDAGFMAGKWGMEVEDE
jgi:hypothetical protein